MSLLNKGLCRFFAFIHATRTAYDLRTLPYRERSVLKSIGANHPSPLVRKRAFELLGAVIGEGTHFNPGVRIVNDYPERGLLHIGRNVAIAPGVIFICNSAPNYAATQLTDTPHIASDFIKIAPIHIEDDVWIGAGAIILPGVRIGKGGIIGAGAVVVSDAPEYMISRGVPARAVKDVRTPKTEAMRMPV